MTTDDATVDLGDVATLVDGLDHPECVTVGPDGFVYAGGEAGQIYRVSLDGDVRVVGATGGFVLGLCVDADANVYACDQALHAVVRVTPDGETRVHSTGTERHPLRTPNHAVFDAHGSLYVSDSGSWKGGDGRLFRIAPDGTTSLATPDALAFPNGVALDPTGEHLYLVLSNEARVVRFPRDADGALGPQQHVLALPRTVPDGIAFDEEEGMLVSCYTPDVIYRYRAPDRFETLVHDWESTRIATPTNVAFAGPDRRTLVIASLSRWHLSTCRVGVPGAPLHHPEL